MLIFHHSYLRACHLASSTHQREYRSELLPRNYYPTTECSSIKQPHTIIDIYIFIIVALYPSGSCYVYMEMHSDLLKRKGVSNSWLILILYRGVKLCPYSYPCYISIWPTKTGSVRYRQRDDTHSDSKVRGASIGPIWGRQNPGGPHVGPMNFAIWAITLVEAKLHQ